MACFFLFYSSSCHKKKHEELRIRNRSRLRCYFSSRPRRKHNPQLRKVQHSTNTSARTTTRAESNTRHSTHKTPGCGTRTRITTHVKEQIHGIRRTHQDAALRRRCKNNIREGRRREDKKISRFILTSSRRGILLIVHGVLTPVSKLC